MGKHLGDGHESLASTQIIYVFMAELRQVLPLMLSSKPNPRARLRHGQMTRWHACKLQTCRPSHPETGTGIL